MDLRAAVVDRATAARKAAALRRHQWRADLLGVGLRAKGAHRSLNVRLLPNAAIDAPLRLDLDIVGAGLSARREHVRFVQVGAFDGLSNDPIHDLILQFGWTGVLVEPAPDAFARLRETYTGVDGLTFINAAVSREPGPVTFYIIDGSEPGDPWWVGQVSSFDRDHVMHHVQDDRRLAARVKGIPVEAISIDSVFERAGGPVDVLQVDAEGRDAEIIDSLDLGRFTPSVIRFEHRHLSGAARAETTRRLSEAGYRIGVNEDDTIAMLHNPGRGTTAVA